MMEDLANFARLVDAIRPWIPHLVIVGGWAHRLHRFHPYATDQEYQPLRTKDVDVAFSPSAPLKGGLSQALDEAGFKEELLGEVTPPVIHYRLGDEDAGFFAEFLTVKKGDGYKRDGKPNLTLFKAGITAQKLRHLELLLKVPWKVHLAAREEIPVQQPVDLLVPNAVSFILQKILIQKHRDSEKRAQDVLYIHDTLQLFGASLEELGSIWENELKPSMSPKTAKRAVTKAFELFKDVTDDVRTAALIPADRNLKPDSVRDAINYGFSEIFGHQA